MYNIPNALIRSRIDDSPQLMSGLTLINELIANRLIPDGVYPIIAGGAMAFSSVSVLLNSLSLNRRMTHSKKG